MIQIRRNVFETNSSSTHSIALSQESKCLYSDKEIEDSFIKIGAVFTPKTEGTEAKDYEDSTDRTLNLATIPEKEWSFQRDVGILDDFANKMLYALLSYQHDKIVFAALYKYLIKKMNLDKLILPFAADPYSDDISFGVGGSSGIDHDSTSMLAYTLGMTDNKYSITDFLERKDVVVLLDQEG